MVKNVGLLETRGFYLTLLLYNQWMAQNVMVAENMEK